MEPNLILWVYALADADEKLGVAAAVDDLMDQATAAGLLREDRGAQLSLLETGADTDGLAQTIEQRGGPGRPKGARNKATKEIVDYLLSRYRHPLVALAETYSRPVADLARELECKKEKAFEIQQRAAEKVAEYVAQKQPQAVELQGDGVAPIALVAAGDMQVHAQATNSLQLLDGMMPIDAEFTEAEAEEETLENQDVSEVQS
jgi:phage gp36-like protein